MQLRNKLLPLMMGVYRHWRAAIAPLVVGVVGAIVISWMYGKHSWESSGTMLYSPLSFSEAEKGLYPHPDLPTLVTLVKSPSVLAALCEEHELDMPTTTLDKIFKVTAARNTQTINVSLAWAEPVKSASMTNRLMELFITQTRDYHRSMAQQQLDDRIRRIAEIDRKQEQAKIAYAKFFTERNLLDAKAEIDGIIKEIEALTTTRSRAQREQIGLAAQRDKISREIEQFRNQAEDQRKFDASLESVADNRRRQDRLRELIEEERNRQLLIVELAAKQKEYDRRKLLYEQSAISKAEWEQVGKEIELLTVKLNENQKIHSWRDELTKIDKMVIPKGEASKTGSPIIQQALFRQLEVDLRMIALEKELLEIDNALTSNRRKQESIAASMRESDSLQKEIDQFNTERVQIAEQAAFFQRLMTSQASEFTIVTVAKPASFPTGSTRKLWFLGTLMVTGAITILRLVWLEYKRTKHVGRDNASKFGLDTLGTLSESSLRSIATALRDASPDYGDVIAFTGDGKTDAWDWAVKIARRFSIRDERVLVIDTRFSQNEGSEGLAEFLSFRTAELDDVLVADDEYPVDLIHAGRGDPDLLAWHRMAEMMTTLSGRYSLIFLVAPSLTEWDNLDLAVRHASIVYPIMGRDAKDVSASLSHLSSFDPKPKVLLIDSSSN